MKNNKLALLPGLSLFVCFCLLIGMGQLTAHFGGGLLLTAGSEVLAFLVPAGMAVFAMSDRKKLRRRLQFRRLPPGAVGLTIKAGLTIAVLSLFLNLLIYQLAGLAGADLSATVLETQSSGATWFGGLTLVLLLSAVVEELYLRGALMTVQEQGIGTGPCLIFSGLAFAMLHGNLMNFLGPMLAGIAYAYLTYIFGSIWPAVLAHTVNNLYYLFVRWITDTYAAFGIWNHFAAVNAIALLLFAYLTLRAAEDLLIKGYIPHFEKSAGLYDLWLLVRNPGVIAFAAAFIVKIVLRWL